MYLLFGVSAKTSDNLFFAVFLVPNNSLLGFFCTSFAQSQLIEKDSDM